MGRPVTESTRGTPLLLFAIQLCECPPGISFSEASLPQSMQPFCRRKSRHQDDIGSYEEARSSKKKKKAKDKGRRRSTKD